MLYSKFQWTVFESERLLSFLKKRVDSSFSNKDLHWCIEHHRCWVNGRVERFASFKLQKKERVVLWPQKRPFFEKEEKRILYEDEDLLAYNKPPFIDSPALATLLNVQLVHRLDRDTSGIILFAKTNKMKKTLEDLFRNKEIQKEYLAIVSGYPGQKGTIDGYMSCKKRRIGACIWHLSEKKEGVFSKTEWKTLKHSNQYSLLLCKPTTGRTHQIRVHLQSLGYPIVGDCDYGSAIGIETIFRPLLHAKQVSFLYPKMLKIITLSAEIEDDFSIGSFKI